MSVVCLLHVRCMPNMQPLSGYQRKNTTTSQKRTGIFAIYISGMPAAAGTAPAEQQVSPSRWAAWMFGAIFVLLLALTIAISALRWNRQHDLAHEHLLDQAGGLRLVVEREVALEEAVANALAAPKDIDKGDWASFHRTTLEASRVPSAGWFVVVEREGQNIPNTNVPFDATLPNARRPLRPAHAGLVAVPPASVA